ncbi:MAG: LytTR family DNA-binding domain-containing protein [Pseudomonadota bacterium]
MPHSIKRVVIVDDEHAARRQLRDVIDRVPGLTVAAEADSGAAGIEAIHKHDPHIVFLDIDMPGVDGFAVAKATEHLMYQLVFLTAHHQYALDAFDTHAVDYLLKPARPAVVEKCLKKVQRQEVLSMERSQSGPARAGGIVLCDSGVSHFLLAGHINFIEGLGRYRRLHLSDEGMDVHDRDTLLSDTTLDQFTEVLSDQAFIRVHRSYLVNLQQIASLQTRGTGNHVCLAGVQDPIPVSRSRLGALRHALEVLHSNRRSVKQ